MSSHKEFIPTGKAVSKAQWWYYKRILDGCPADQRERKRALLDALDVDYDSLPDRAGSAPRAPKASPQSTPPATKPLEFPPEGYATVSALLHRNGVKLTPDQRDAVNNLGYFVKAPGIGILGLVHNPEKKGRLKARFPFIKTVLTQREVTGFLALEDDRINNLRQAAELLASPAPAEPVLPTPKAPVSGWVDDDPWGTDEDDDVFAN
jgi:hypothetical protein